MSTQQHRVSTRSDDTFVADLPAVGTRVDGKYRIVETLGIGGMGVVLRGHDEQLARDVALKLIRPEFVANDAVRTQFVHEARAMARVRHTNVVDVYSLGDYKGLPYFVMEYVNGENLRQWHVRQGSRMLAVDEALGFLSQICRGLQAIHEAGVVHHDIKPSNVLIGPNFRVAIADLGLVRVVDPEQTGSTGSMAGTLSYLAPEVALREPVAPELAARADMYSLGVLAFELLVGRLPFVADSAVEMLRQHLEEPPPRASDIRPDLPPAFDAPLARALAKDPAERTPSAQQLRRDLFEARPSYASP